MKLTRKHFQAIAYICPISRAKDAATLLASTNPRFDNQRFLDAVTSSATRMPANLTQKDKNLVDSFFINLVTEADKNNGGNENV